MIRTGAWQAQGTAHAREGKACQDAAVARAAPFGAVCAVSDGCSSAKDSETGAWILARAAAESFASGESGWGDPKEDILERVLRRAVQAAKPLGISMGKALATLCLLLANEEEGSARLLMWGDGFAGAVDLEGERSASVWSSGSEGNAPFYPGYRLEPEILERWMALGDKAWAGFGEARIERSKEELALGLEARIAMGKGSLLFVSTDGAGSLPGVEPETALGEIAKIKGLAGDFLERRMSRAAKDWGKAGASPQDDFSIACVLRESAGSQGEG